MIGRLAIWRRSLFARVALVVTAAGLVAIAVATLTIVLLVRQHEEATLVDAAVEGAVRRRDEVQQRVDLARAQLRAVAFAVQAGRLLEVPATAENTADAILAFRDGVEVLEAAASEEAASRLRGLADPEDADITFDGEAVVVAEQVGDVRAYALVELGPALVGPAGWTVGLVDHLDETGGGVVAHLQAAQSRVHAVAPFMEGRAVRVDAPLAPAREAAFAITRRMALWSSLAVVPLLFLAWVFSRAVTRPVRHLARAVREARDGPVPLPALSDDEIGDLGNAIAAMSERLHEDARALRNAVQFSRKAEVDDGPQRVLGELRLALDGSLVPWIVVASPAHDELLASHGASPAWLAKQTTSEAATSPGCVAVTLVAGAVAIPLHDGERDHGVILTEGPVDAQSVRFAELLARTAVVRLRNAALARQAMVGEKLGLLGRLSAGVAHEMNTPLAFIQANLLALEEELDGEARSSITDARLGVERLVRIVRDLSAISVGGSAVSSEVVDLTRLCRDMVRMARARRPNGTIDVVSGGDVRIECDRGRIEQVVLNLVNNALDAVGADGHVEVHVAKLGERVVLEVSDDGPGIPQDVKDKLFEAFYTTKGQGGTGLGLYLSRSFVEAHGGELSIPKTGPEGTTFRVRLPAALEPKERESTPPALASVQGAPRPRAGRPRVLVVDDEPAVVRAMKRWLKRRADVTGTTDPHEALRLLERERFELVLCDMNMPGMSGRELAEALRERDPALADRVVIVTGSSGTPPPELRVVRKPLDAEVLDQLLGEAPRTRGAA